MNEDNPESGSEFQEQEAEFARLMGLDARVKLGANWFYWIAALSVVNSIIVMAQGDWSFIVGLGVSATLLTRRYDKVSRAFLEMDLAARDPA